MKIDIYAWLFHILGPLWVKHVSVFNIMITIPLCMAVRIYVPYKAHTRILLLPLFFSHYVNSLPFRFSRSPSLSPSLYLSIPVSDWVFS